MLQTEENSKQKSKQTESQNHNLKRKSAISHESSSQPKKPKTDERITFPRVNQTNTQSTIPQTPTQLKVNEITENFDQKVSLQAVPFKESKKRFAFLLESLDEKSIQSTSFSFDAKKVYCTKCTKQVHYGQVSTI